MRSTLAAFAVSLGYALLGVAFIAYGFVRQQRQEAAILEGQFVPFGRGAALAFTIAGIALGAATLVVVVA